VSRPFFSITDSELTRIRIVTTRILWVLSGAALVVFCAIRAPHFKLQPLDAPGTLHPILLQWLSPLIDIHNKASHEAVMYWEHWCYSALCVTFALAFLNHFFARSASLSGLLIVRMLRSPALFFLSVAVCLFLFRAPLLLGGASNVDESEFTASATKLFVDPVYFRAVDCNTSGPLNIYILMLPALVGLSPDYASSRVIALGIIFASFYFLYRGFRLLAGEDLARIAILAALVFFSTVSYGDFVHYSSEHLAILLTAGSVFACIRLFPRPETWRSSLIGIGFLTSAAFFAKMQSVPIIASVAVVATAFVYWSRAADRFWKPVVFLAIGLVPLPLLTLAVCAATGTFENFWISYILANWRYARHGANFFSSVPGLASFIGETAEFPWLIVAALTLLAAALLRNVFVNARTGIRIGSLLILSMFAVGAAMYVRAGTGQKAHPAACAFLFWTAAAAIALHASAAFMKGKLIGWLGLLSGAVLAGSIASLYGSHQTLPHYLILLVMPVCTALGWLLFSSASKSTPRLWSPPTWFAIFFMAVFGAVSIWAQPHLEYNYRAAEERNGAPEGAMIRTLTTQNSSIAVWGWHPKTYLDAGRVQATRDTNMSRFFWYGKDLNDFYRARFLRDLERSKPELFVDAIDVSCCYINDRKTQGFEAIPEINSYIHAHYVQVAKEYGEQFYLRRDLVNPGR